MIKQISLLSFTLVLFSVALAQQDQDELAPANLILMNLTAEQAFKLALYGKDKSFYYPYCTDVLAIITENPEDMKNEFIYGNMKVKCETIYAKLQSDLSEQGIEVSLADLKNPEIAKKLVSLSKASARTQREDEKTGKIIKKRQKHKKYGHENK